MKDGDTFERVFFWLLVVVCEDYWLGAERVEESGGKRVLSVVGHRARSTVQVTRHSSSLDAICQKSQILVNLIHILV
jgi:hypothetical protein